MQRTLCFSSTNRHLAIIRFFVLPSTLLIMGRYDAYVKIQHLASVEERTSMGGRHASSQRVCCGVCEGGVQGGVR